MVSIDVKKACDLVDEKAAGENHARIYFSSNESLKDLFQHFSVKDKEVLSVMASSDQYFYSYYNGAKNVDTFDINVLTKYYYYLRYWSILYNNQFYPDKTIFQSHQYIYDLLQKVKCESLEERHAYRFWSEFIRKAFPFDCGNLYYYGVRENPIVDLKTLKEQIRGKDISFTHLDLFEEVPKKKKYDIIITSNILEYAGYDKLRLIKARNNLKSMLNENGKVISSHYFHQRYDSFFAMEREIFHQTFDYVEFPYAYDFNTRKNYPIGYSYTLKDVNKK